MLHILNSKQTNEIIGLISEQWGVSFDTDYVFLKHDDGRVYLATRGLASLDFSKMRVNSLGLYLGEVNNDEIRLSIEGAQLIGPKAKKNVVEIGRDMIEKWVGGEDLEIETGASGFVIIKQGEDFFGSGKYKNGRILNFVPKARRLQTVV